MKCAIEVMYPQLTYEQICEVEAMALQVAAKLIHVHRIKCTNAFRMSLTHLALDAATFIASPSPDPTGEFPNPAPTKEKS